METGVDAIPAVFCWTKFGVEAGDDPRSIRARKERERKAGGGIFYWGIGSSVAPSLEMLVRDCAAPEVLFTPMLSKPATADVFPERVVSWHSGRGLDGRHYALGSGVVTSRASRRLAPARHFALVCSSDLDLRDDLAPVYFDDDCVVNLRTGSRVGSSQVTSVVRRNVGPAARSRDRYRVAFRARLVPPYFLTLSDPDVATREPSPASSEPAAVDRVS